MIGVRDGWHPTRVTPEDFRARLAVLRDMAAREGKDLGRIALCPKTSYDRCRDVETFMAFKQAGATDILIDFLTDELDDLYWGPGRDGPRYFAPDPGMRAAASLSQMTNAGCAWRFVKLIGTSTFIGIWSLDIGHFASRRIDDR